MPNARARLLLYAIFFAILTFAMARAAGAETPQNASLLDSRIVAGAADLQPPALFHGTMTEPILFSATVSAPVPFSISRAAQVSKPGAHSRPRLLVPLYVSFVSLQGVDAATTIRALDAGAVEANPVIGGIARNRAALLAMKASASAGTIYLSERLWKKNRVAAVALMAALNGAYAVVAAHNYRTAR